MRFHDAEEINRVANQPDIERLLSGKRPVVEYDFSGFLSNGANIGLHHLGAFSLCEWSAPRVFQCHLVIPSECRGKTLLRAYREMGDYMLTYHADMLWGQPASSNKTACKLIEKVGFSLFGYGYHDEVGTTTLYVRRG